MSTVFVFNSGSSSIKFQILDPHADDTADDQPIVSGLVERIGEPEGNIEISIRGQEVSSTGAIADHTDGLNKAMDLMKDNGVDFGELDIVAVGHRVVHGGRTFSEPVVIDDKVLSEIRRLIPLAPLHNPANLDGIVSAQELFPDIPHVAVFDTGFFNGMPQGAANYALNRKVALENGIRRYGFHGTSHEFVSAQVPALLDKPAEEVNQIVFHIGNGASASAIRGTQPVDTSMGLTPLSGLVMGTRTGDIDPGIIFHLINESGRSIAEIDTLFNRESGLKGIAGSNDMREVHRLRAEGDENAQLAFDIYITQLRRVLGSYLISLGRVDAITFTAGVGENDAQTRAAGLADLEMFGIKLDPEKNESRSGGELAGGAREISADDSSIKVFVVPTNEELAIARKSFDLAQG